jgi:transposase InsO family protein
MNTLSIRSEFVLLTLQDNYNFKALCQRFGISTKTGYKWRQRYLDNPPEVPAPSTITNILHRHGLIFAQAREQAQHWQRFEHDQPNALWQIDFKGNFNTAQKMCFPLTLLDDYSRFTLTLTACGKTTAAIVQTHLTDVFLRYGLPARINADGHSQTNGKEERFHRTLKAEVLNGRAFSDLAHVQYAFNDWGTVYNEQRPHEALGLATPITRYKLSLIAMPSALPEIEYGPNDQVITVGWGGEVKLQNHKFKVFSALHR